jgi:hypothetical protein
MGEDVSSNPRAGRIFGECARGGGAVAIVHRANERLVVEAPAVATND